MDGLNKFIAGDYKGAIQDHTLAVKKNPKDAQSYYNMGLAKYRLEDYTGSIVAYTSAIELNSNDGFVYSGEDLQSLNLVTTRVL